MRYCPDSAVASSRSAHRILSHFYLTNGRRITVARFHRIRSRRLDCRWRHQYAESPASPHHLDEIQYLRATSHIVGYVKTGSVPSIAAGMTVGLLCRFLGPLVFTYLPSSCDVQLTRPLDGLGGYRLQNRQTYGVELALLASMVLGGSSIPRAVRLGKPVPIVLSFISVFGLITFGNAFRKSL